MAAASAQLLAFAGPRIGLRAALMPALKRHRLPEMLAESFIREAGLLRACGIDEALTQVLAARMRTTRLDFARTPRLFLMGPSGAGVKSVAAKLRHQAASLERNIIIEESGFNPLNCRARAAFACLDQRTGVETIGVISALADAEEVSEIISQFRLKRVIVTGLDMARRLGALTAALTQGAEQVGVTCSAKASVSLEILTPQNLARLLLR